METVVTAKRASQKYKKRSTLETIWLQLRKNKGAMIVSNASIESDKPITTAMFSSDTIQHTLLANLGIHQFIAVGK